MAMPSNIQGWSDVKADFGDTNRMFYTAQQGLSNAGTIFGQLRASILEEEQRRVDNAFREKELTENIRQFDTKQDLSEREFGFEKEKEGTRQKEWQTTFDYQAEQDKIKNSFERARISLANARNNREVEAHKLEMDNARQELMATEVSRLTRVGLFGQNMDDFTKEVAASNIPDDMKQKLVTGVTAARTANGGSEIATYKSAQDIVAGLTGRQFVGPDLDARDKALKDRITTTEQKVIQREQDAYNKHLQTLSDITDNIGSKSFRQDYEKATQMLISAGIAPTDAYETMRQFAFTDALSGFPTYEKNDQIREFINTPPDKLWKTTVGSKALQAQKTSQTNVSNLRNGLRKEGLTDSEIDKILGPKTSGGTLTQKGALSSTSSLLEDDIIKERLLKLGITANDLGQVEKLAQNEASKDYSSAIYRSTSEYIDSPEPKVQPRHYIEAARKFVLEREAAAKSSARKQEEEERERAKGLSGLATALDEAVAASERVHEIRRPVTN